MAEVRAGAGLPPLPAWDFSLPGVSSMSLDLHKYGYTAKGASTVLYRDRAFYSAQVFDFDDWPCGRMNTPTFAGTRPGGAIAAAWAVLHYLGRAGYVAKAGAIHRARERLRAFCARLDLPVYGEPLLSILAFGDRQGDILAAGQGLYKAGWFSSRVQNPDGIQVMLSPGHEPVLDGYLDELERQIVAVRASGGRAQDRDIRYS
ncbi:MAG: hypothetical protein R3E84_12720 [Pseudomonadales bacterium]